MTKQIITALLLVAGLAAFVTLGVWQLQRLAWKHGVLAEIEAQIAGEAVALPADPDPEADRYLPVEIAGTMEPDELHVLVSSRDYGAGFRIIAPFETRDGRRIMVDRGFVLNETKDAERQIGEMGLEGNLHWPDERDGFTPEDDPEGNWWYARDVEKMSDALGTEPVLVIARTETDPGIRVMPVTTEGIPNDHFEYAMTWFLMAVTWVGMTGFALWRIRRRNAGGTAPTRGV
ncbi:SURF1 family protein [Maritimibacter dapengensis]|uniref:SURF1-like protein n=1 Tax=Maritimibacter dapengensis TaxID=2836868 RepID=A0ABS6T0W4_9RHOB|nr:SURF1 family protein [Maritimibacter dapengensis]MBV7378749.1 SURF1 family protein [Maritimibacter dapengensis]